MGGGGDFLLFFASLFLFFLIEKGNAKHPESLDKANTDLPEMIKMNIQEPVDFYFHVRR